MMITSDPMRHSAQPQMPSRPSRSLRKMLARTALFKENEGIASVSLSKGAEKGRTHPMMTDSAPKGVTRIAGAN